MGLHLEYGLLHHRQEFSQAQFQRTMQKAGVGRLGDHQASAGAQGPTASFQSIEQLVSFNTGEA